jgi:hypothetical protein
LSRCPDACGLIRPDGSPVELTVAPEADEATGEVILFVDDGKLSYLEYVYYSELPPKAWPSDERLSLIEPR